MRVPQDVIMQLDNSGYWTIYNVFFQTTLAVCDQTMLLLKQIQQGKKLSELESLFNTHEFNVKEMGVFSNFSGLLADPTRRIRNIEQWPEAVILTLAEVIQLLEEKKMVVVNEAQYSTSFKLKDSLLDRENLGNFHQQLGQELLLEKRVDPAEWWVNQKFNAERTDLNDNLYKSVQQNFLKSFYASRFNSSHKVLDMGCGIGYYSNMMAQTGAEILGIDPNQAYIETARKNFKQANLSFKVSEIGLSIESTQWIESNSFDFVFMSDTLLFYFVSPDPKISASINVLFSEIKRILKPNGRFFSLEPHGVFWLRPWLGEEDRPFTVITEYRNKLFNVAPNHQELLKSYHQEDFILKDMQELYADQSVENSDKRAVKFADTFPVWWFFELEANK